MTDQHLFDESLLRFCEFHAKNIDNKLMSLYGDEGSNVINNLNNYFLRNLTNTKADIRFANLVLKFWKYRLIFHFTKKSQVYYGLIVFANRLLKIKLCK